jgi:DNA-binding beta-propeller fold protein YncE
MRELFRKGSLGFALVLMAGACTGASTGPFESGSSRSVPDPFTVLARFSPSSLGLKEPTGLAIGPDGNLYVTDLRGQTVTVVTPEGTVLRRWGAPGRRAGQFRFRTDAFSNPLASIAVGPDGSVYVSDSGNARIQVFSPTGAFLRQVGSRGEGEGEFLEPFDLTVDPNGNLYVVDHTRETISKFAPDGAFVWRIGGKGALDVDLRGEFHLASVDPHGRIVTTSDVEEAVVYVDHHGRKVDLFHTTGDFPTPRVGPCDVTVDDAGNTFVESCGGPWDAPTAVPPDQFELVFDRSHRLIGAWYDSPFLKSPRFGPHGEVFALAADGSILKLRVALDDA